MIQVFYQDGTEELYPTIASAEEAVSHAVKDSDFSNQIDEVYEINFDGSIKRQLWPVWSLRLSTT